VKQRCGLKEFIEINDELERHSRFFFLSNEREREGEGERARQQRDGKRESVRDRVLLEMRESVDNKTDP
jgi:hypothetical protein